MSIFYGVKKGRIPVKGNGLVFVEFIYSTKVPMETRRTIEPENPISQCFSQSAYKSANPKITFFAETKKSGRRCENSVNFFTGF